MKVLITGGAGFIGSHVADVLLTQGFDVLVVDDLSSGKESNLSKKIELVKMNILSEAFHKLIVKVRPQVICHLAAQVSVRVSMEDPTEDANVNILGTIRVLQGAREADTEKIVLGLEAAAAYAEITSTQGMAEYHQRLEETLSPQLPEDGTATPVYP